jgi:hypothetical protein
MRTLEKSTFIEQSAILDTDPAVSMDVDLGKSLQPGEVINVDFDALRKVLKETGAPKDSSDVSLDIKSPANTPKGMAGAHNPYTKETLLRFTGNESKMQGVLQHELRHYADFVETPPTDAEARKNRIGLLGAKAANLAALPTLLFTAGSIGSNVPAVENSATSVMSETSFNTLQTTIEAGHFTSVATSLGALAVMGTFYWANKRERTARKAEKLNLPRVISVQKSNNS